MTEPRELVDQVEEGSLPPGEGERFAGYGVMGLPFSSGHIFAMRRFPVSSVGPGYTSVWHRDAEGRWSLYQDVDADRACPRYFGEGAMSRRRQRWRSIGPVPGASTSTSATVSSTGASTSSPHR